jgi:hypothetical protein
MAAGFERGADVFHAQRFDTEERAQAELLVARCGAEERIFIFERRMRIIALSAMIENQSVAGDIRMSVVALVAAFNESAQSARWFNQVPRRSCHRR